MDMKKILQAMDGVSTKPVEGASDMAKFVSIINEGANPHKVSLPVQMAMQHYQEVEKPRVLGKKESLLKQYVAEAEAAAEERAEEKRDHFRQYAKVIAERVIMKESAVAEAPIVHKNDIVKTDLQPGEEVACDAGMGKTIFGVVKRIGRTMIHVQTKSGNIAAFAPKHVTRMTPTYWQDKAEANKPKWMKKKGLEEGTVERRIDRQQQLIQSYADRAKMTKNPIKKQHYLAMIDQLSGELDSMINDYNEHERAGNEIGRHDEEPSSMWENQEEFNQPDAVTLDIPLLIRLLEYAREDAKTDMDLHNVAERLIDLSDHSDTLTMDNYDAIVGSQLDESGIIKPKKKTSTCRAGQVQTGMQTKDGKLVPKCSVK